MITGGSSKSTAGDVAARLIGLEIPHGVVLDGGFESPVDLYRLARERPAAFYFYPGCINAEGGGEETARLDAAQHRAFRDHQPDFEAWSYRTVGISSQSKDSQRQTVLISNVSHQLLCDPNLELARALGLPTFTRDGANWYERITLVVRAAVIEKAFYPVSSAQRSAAQVIAWMTVRGDPTESGDDAN